MAASYDGDGNRVFQISRSKAVTTVLKSDTSDAEKNPEASNSGIADPETPGSFENNPSGIEDVPSSNQTEVRTYYEKIYVDPADSIFWYGFGQGLMNFFGNINSALSSYLSNWFCTAWDYVTGQYDLVLHSEEETESVTYSEADIEAMKKAGLTEEDILAVTCGVAYTESAEICTDGTLTSETVVIPENGENDTETVNASYELTYYVNNVNTENTQVLMEYGKRDELKSVYTYGLNRISVETIADTYNPTLDEFETDYYLYDGRGSVANVVTDSSEIVASYSYDPFGNITKGAPAFDCFYGYNAEETNPVTGLQYLRARYYDTETGRFGTKDSVLGDISVPVSLNRYIYTINNPLMYVDASGNWFHALVGAVVGAVTGAVTGVVSEVVTAVVEKRPVSLKKAAVNAAAGAAGGAVAGAVFATTGSVKLASVAGGAVGGAVGGFVGTVADGGSVKSALVNAGKGAIAGAVGGLVGGSVGGAFGSQLVGSVVGSVAGGAAGQATSTLLNGGSLKDAAKAALDPKKALTNGLTGVAGYGVAKVTSAGGARAERYVVDKTAAAKKAIQEFACGNAKKVTAQDPIEDVTPDVPEVVEDLTPEVVDTPDGVNGVGDKGTISGTKPYANSRPSFRKGVVEKVWENAKGPDGLVRDPNTGDIIDWNPGETRNGVWDMGHIPEAKYSEMHKAYMNGDLTTEEFVDWYNDPNNYRPELPSNNRSHKYE